MVKTASSPASISSIEHESATLSSIKSQSPTDNIVNLLATSIRSADNFPLLIFPYIPGGSIESAMHHLRQSTTLKDRLRLLISIASAVAILESQNILHRDLKASNILLNKSFDTPYLSDFGTSTHFSDAKSNKPRHSTNISIKGSPYHMAPEVLSAKFQSGNQRDSTFAYGIAQEMYSFGMLSYEIIEMKTPYLGVVGGLPGTITRDELRRRIVEEEYRPRFTCIDIDNIDDIDDDRNRKKQEKDLKNNLICLVEKCWAQNPLKRPNSFADVHNELRAMLVSSLPSLPSQSSWRATKWAQIGSATDVGGRKNMEDVVVVPSVPVVPVVSVSVPPIQSNEESKVKVVGVFDGHNGDHVALRAKHIVEKTIAHTDTIDFNDALSINMLSKLFQTVEHDLSKRKDTLTSGTTATIAVIERTETVTHLHVGWVGDSRAVVLEMSSLGHDGHDGHDEHDGHDGHDGHAVKKIILETKNHSPSEESERNRIVNEGGKVDRLKKMRDDGVEMAYGPHRVYGSDGSGGLAVSRALGDLKWRPWVSSTHESKTLSWSSGLGKKIILVLATDGMWDVTTDEELFQMVNENLKEGPNAVANALVRRAVDEKQTQDNCAVVVVSIL